MLTYVIKDIRVIDSVITLIQIIHKCLKHLPIFCPEGPEFPIMADYEFYF